MNPSVGLKQLWLLVLSVLVVGLSNCTSGGTTRLVVTITADEVLFRGGAIDAIAGVLMEAGQRDFTSELVLQPVQTWTITIPKQEGATIMEVRAVGKKGDNEVVSNAAYAVITRGQQSGVTLNLTTACAGANAPKCSAAETCSDGRCTRIPGTPLLDGGQGEVPDGGGGKSGSANTGGAMAADRDAGPGGGGQVAGSGGGTSTGGVLGAGGGAGPGGKEAVQTGGSSSGGMAGNGQGGAVGGQGASGGAGSFCLEAETRCLSEKVMQACSSGKWGLDKACGSNQTCPANGTRCICKPNPSCPSLGSNCSSNGDAIVVCANDTDGCLVQSATASCKGPHQFCTGASGSATCACKSDPLCSAQGMFCSSSTSLVACSLDADSCLYSTTPSSCPAGSVCERISPASCADPNYAAWPVAPDINPTNYVNNQDGTISDTKTGLMWLERYGNGDWNGANNYCAMMSSNKAGGYSDWRLPTVIELFSIIDYGKYFERDAGPTLNWNFFESYATGALWTANRRAGSSTEAWSLSLFDGSLTYAATSYVGMAFCVR